MGSLKTQGNKVLDNEVQRLSGRLGIKWIESIHLSKPCSKHLWSPKDVPVVACNIHLTSKATKEDQKNQINMPKQC